MHDYGLSATANLQFGVESCMRFKIAILLVACFAGIPASAQTLWGRTELGMSVANVLSVLPQAMPITEKRDHIADAEELLRIPEFELVGSEFVVKFFFRNEKLVQVNLSTSAPNVTSMFVTFDALSNALQARYGQPIEREVKQAGFVKKANAKWLSGRTDISLSTFGSEGMAPLVSLNYSARIAEEADKL